MNHPLSFIDTSLIQIPPNRQRRRFDEGELADLRESIRSRGLLHALVLREVAGKFFLVAGERRLRAIQDLWALDGGFSYDGRPVPKGLVPYSNLRDLSELEALEAEYEENVQRTDLSWQEKAAATAALMRLRNAQAEAAGQPAFRPVDLVREVEAIPHDVPDGEVGGPVEKARREIIVAGHLDDPEVAAAKSLDESWKVLKRKENARRAAELGERVGRTFSAAAHRAIHGDCFAWMAAAEPEQFDVILTDPPYGLEADEFGDSGGKAAAHGYADSVENFITIMRDLPKAVTRLAKPEAHLYLFCDISWFQFTKEIFSEAGWRVFRTPLIWYKPAAYRAPWPEHGPQRKYETILYAIRGNKRVNRLAPDVLTYPPDENLGHAAQKPVGLFADLLSRSVQPGNTVLDPFAGSGTIFPAAHELKCAAVGIEQDQAAYGLALQRIGRLT